MATHGQQPQRQPRQWLEVDRAHRLRWSGSGSGKQIKQQQKDVPGFPKQQQRDSRENQYSKMKGMSFSVYVDGLSDRITLQKLRTIFGKAGKVCDVFIQFRKKFQRRFRYGFVRFQFEEEAWEAIRHFNGFRLEGNYLVVKRARITQETTKDKEAVSVKPKTQAPRKVWRPKVQDDNEHLVKGDLPTKQGAPAQPVENVTSSVGCQLSLSASDLDIHWYQRCARARTIEAKPVNVIQDELAQIGMYNFRFIPLGANEVLLEFESKEERESTLTECSFWLEKKLTELRPCTLLTHGIAHLVWIRLWHVPLGLWTDSFFTAVGHRLGTFVKLDIATKQRYRADFASILVRMHHPLLQCFSMAVNVEGTSCVILVEKDESAYDYGKVEGMPSTPVKIYNSEDDDMSDENSVDNEDGDDDGAHALVHYFDKDYESSVDVVSDEEDEVFRNEKFECLHSTMEVDMIQSTEAAMEHGGDYLKTQGFVTSPAAGVGHEQHRPAVIESEEATLISKSKHCNDAINSGEDYKGQFHDLVGSGYTMEEIEEWRRNLCAEGLKTNKNQICPFEFQNSICISNNNQFSVTGYSFNTHDMFQKYSWPLFSTYWDPLHIQQQQMIKPCLPHGFYNQNHFFRFATSSTTLPASETKCVARTSRETFIRTSPHQIVRQTTPSIITIPLVRDCQDNQTPQTSVPQAASDPSAPTPLNSPNTNSSKKSSQRGRPKGSKNKPIPLPEDYLEPVTGEDGVSTRAQRAWLIGKQLGLKPRGSEALMLRGLEAQIRENHPHLN